MTGELSPEISGAVHRETTGVACQSQVNVNSHPTIDATNPVAADDPDLRPWKTVVLAALAGGMGWGIRGQYGHETGAMIAGLLVSLVLVMLLRPRALVGPAARAVAMATVAIGFGGSMTYGQTVGLTHDPDLVGNLAAWRWGMLGLAIKGSIWIGFFGLFLGMGLGAVRYRAVEILGLMLGFLGLYAIGTHLFNRPFDPANQILPRLYFSADWHWRPGAVLKPRQECWGGLLLALWGGWAYVSFVRRDALARRLMLWACLGGALGFPGGQCVQAFHAWHAASFKTGIWTQIDPVMNWWNWMETTFGTIMGASVGLGLWLNRSRIDALAEPVANSIRPPVEWLLLLLHVGLLVTEEFGLNRWVSVAYDLGLILGVIPMVAVVGGRLWPVFVALPVTLIPIAGKTIEHLVYEQRATSPLLGWTVYGVVPVVSTFAFSLRWIRRDEEAKPGADGRFVPAVLLWVTWLYFGLNYAFFRFPWPWGPWTARTPNSLFYWMAALTLTAVAIRSRRALVGR